jgi:uncharacterized RDD family membrane protein YckC
MANGPYRFDTPSTRPASMPPTGGFDVREATDGVLGKRLFAYLVDLVIICLLMAFLAFVIGILGIVTFGLAWWLYAVLVPGTAILYSAATVGGRHQSTIGMRMVGLRVIDSATGGPVDKVTAAVHALLFYVAAGTFVLWVLDLFIGVARADRRLGHDLVVGILLVRAR